MSFATAHEQAKLYEQDIALLDNLLSHFQNPSPDPVTQTDFSNAFANVLALDLSAIVDGETKDAINGALATCYEAMKTVLGDRRDALNTALGALDCS